MKTMSWSLKLYQNLMHSMDNVLASSNNNNGTGDLNSSMFNGNGINDPVDCSLQHCK